MIKTRGWTEEAPKMCDYVGQTPLSKCLTMPNPAHFFTKSDKTRD